MSSSNLAIDYLYFHYVEKDGDVKTLPKGGTSKLSGKAILKTYGSYFQKLVAQNPSAKSYYVLKGPSTESVKIQGKFDALKRYVIPADISKLRKTANWFAVKLMKVLTMKNPGVLFIGLFRYNGIRYVGLFKLEWVDTPYAIFDSKNSEIILKYLTKALPASSGRLQKGAIYPHPDTSIGAYMKVFEKDGRTEYFKTFLGGRESITGLDMIREIRKLALDLNSGKLSIKQSFGLYNGLSTHLGQKKKDVSKTDVIRIIGQALPSLKKPEIRKYVTDEIETEGIVKASEVVMVRARFSIGDISINGPLESISKYFFEDGGGPNRHILEGQASHFRME
ncbi:MAG: hypothetical protein ACTSUO_03415 [Candidatus Thorarchaeota archaeon]